MATDKESSTANQKPGKEESSGHATALLRTPNDIGPAQRRGWDLLGFPLTPYPVLRMNPFNLLHRLTEEFERTLQLFAPEDKTNLLITWVPTVEVSHRDGTWRMLAELPGLTPDQVRVEAEDGALILQGERRVEHDAVDEGVHRSERQFGFFYRRVPLPEGADPNQATAKFHDGILEITMPAPAPKVERRKIQIETDSKTASGEAKQAA
jgi:HSP20 family protein